MSRGRLSILISVHNNARSIQSVLESLLAAASYFQSEQIDATLSVVDDGSSDGSDQLVEAFAKAHPEARIRFAQQTTSTGRGASIRRAIREADADYCLVLRADCFCEPSDYQRLLAPLFSAEADVVLGSRFMSDLRSGLADRVVNAMTRLACGRSFSDVRSGYMAFRTSLGQSIPLRSKRFGVEAEMLIQLSKRHANFAEVPVYCKLAGVRKSVDWQIALTIGRILATRWLSRAHTDPAADMLVAMSGAKRFNRWMADTVGPWILGDVLELGAGIGNLTIHLSAGRSSYTATDTNEEHLAMLGSRVSLYPNVRIAVCDFLSSEDVEAFRQSADTVVCLNVLEHVSDDLAGLTSIRSCLRLGGRAIVLVPQGPQVFGSLDEVLHHKRRYRYAELEQKMTASGFQVERIIEFNRATYPGWYLNSRLLRRRTLDRVQLGLFDLLVPVLKRIDKWLPWPATSLIAIGTAR